MRGLGSHFPPYRIIVNSDIIRPEPHAPDKPLQHIKMILNNESNIKGFSPILPSFFKKEIRETGSTPLTGEFIFEKEVLISLQDKKQTSLSTLQSSFTVYETQSDLPFGVFLVDTSEPTVLVVLCESTGEVRGVVHDDMPSAVQWATDAFQKHLTDATIVG